MEKKNDLTFSQQVIFDCVKRYYKAHRETPTLREICKMAGLNTVSTVQVHLKNLQKKGYIDVEPRTKRGITILKGI